MALTMNYCHTREVSPDFKLGLCNLAITIQTNSLTQLSYSLLQLPSDSSAPAQPPANTVLLARAHRLPGAAATGTPTPGQVPCWGGREDLRLSPSPAPGQRTSPVPEIKEPCGNG